MTKLVTRKSLKRWIVAGATTALVLAGGGLAAGYALGRTVTVKPGESAVFSNGAGSGWWCHSFRATDREAHGRAFVGCGVGDATPYVELVAPSASPLQVKVVGISTKVTKTSRRVCGDPKRCWVEVTYAFTGGAGG